MNNTIGDRIRTIRERRGLTQETLADLANVNRVTIAKYESNRIAPSSKTLRKLAIALNVSVDEIVNDNSKLQSSATVAFKIPVLGAIPAGIPLEEIEDIIDWQEIPADWTRGGKQYFALEIHGNSMLPRYENGDVIILRKTETCENGQDCAIRINGNEATFKRVRKTPHGIMLQAINPDFESYSYTNDEIANMPIEILGVVEELRRKIN